MTTSPGPTNETNAEKGLPVEQSRDAAFWSQRVTGLKVSNVPSGALNLNVDGKLVNGPLQGFGKMWQKTYHISLKGVSVTPIDIIKKWKENFSQFWPRGNHFYGPLTGIAPGEVALLNLSLTGGLKLSTGVLVLYADEESFTLMTPQGHVFAGWITFSAFEEDGNIVAQAQVLMRANDPIYEIGFRLGMYKDEDKFWQHTLTALAKSFDVNEVVQMEAICVDPRVQWPYARNVWHNAAMRTTMYKMTAPVRWIRGQGRNRQKK